MQYPWLVLISVFLFILQVLISEVSKLRGEADENIDRFNHQQQFVNNMSAARNTEEEDKACISELQNQVSALEEELRGSTERYTDIYNYNKMLELQLEDSAREEVTRGHPAELDTTGMNANNLLMLFKERAGRAEEALEQLQGLYEQAQLADQQHEGAAKDQERRLKVLEEGEFSLQKKEEALRSREMCLREKEETLKHIMSRGHNDEEGARVALNSSSQEDCQVSLSKTPLPDLGVKAVQDTFPASALEDAHAWWSYVWHEMRKGSQNHQLYSGGSSRGSGRMQSRLEEVSVDGSEEGRQVHDEGDPLGIWSEVVIEDLEQGQEEGKEDVDLVKRKKLISKHFIQQKNSQIDRLRNVVRSHAIEITTLRQAKLLSGMQSKQAVEVLKEKLEWTQREVHKLQAYNRQHRGDKEIQLTEMTATIKSLTARSDMHSALASAHQDLEAERLVVGSLRSDIESYRELLEGEREKVAEGRREHEKARAALAASEIAESLLGVPGLLPGALIELFSGRLMWLQAELVKARSAASSLSMMQQGGGKGRGGGHSTQEDVSPLRSHQSPLSSSEKTKGGQSPSPVAHPLQEHLSFREPEHWQKELLQKAVTPEKVLSSLDTVLLARRVSEQSMTIESLEQHVAELEAALTSVTIRDHMVGLSTSEGVGDGEEHLDRLGEQARIERTATLRRLDLCQENLKQSQDQVEKMRARVVYAESSYSDCKKKLEERSVQHCKPCVACCKRIEKREGGDGYDVALDESESDVENESLLVLLDDARGGEKLGGISSSSKCAQCDRVQQLLQERTTQLKIMMETLEALQLGELKQLPTTTNPNSSINADGSSAAAGGSSLEEIMANLDHGSSMSRDDARLEQLLGGRGTGHGQTLRSAGQRWEARALVKRVVELTADSSAHCSALAISDRHTKQLEADKGNLLKEVTKLLKKTKRLEANAFLLQEKYSSVLLSVNRVEKLRVEEKEEATARLEEVIRVARERENECDQLRVSNEEMKQQMSLADRSAFQKWFVEVVVSGSQDSGGDQDGAADNISCVVDGNHPTRSDTSGSNDSVRDLVVTLLVQWREQVSLVWLSLGAPASLIFLLTAYVVLGWFLPPRGYGPHF